MDRFFNMADYLKPTLDSRRRYGAAFRCQSRKITKISPDHALWVCYESKNTLKGKLWRLSDCGDPLPKIFEWMSHDWPHLGALETQIRLTLYDRNFLAPKPN
jgi:hypothetical protein